MKETRLEKIKQLINENKIETQDELCKKLQDAGYDVTQATVSRDIRKLQLTKISDKTSGKQYYTLIKEHSIDHSLKLNRVLQESFVDMIPSLNILVIKTVSGMAMAFAAALDNFNFKDIIGCVAGDDTVICVISSIDDMDNVMLEINNLLS